ncbi:MAG: hypothetical protein H0Z40_11545, partial [Desulfotomaculum sp.]|nr:hypothetical protein [Desulfotomaculum sp.]
MSKNRYKIMNLDGIVIFIDPRIKPEDSSEPLEISYSGWWIFHKLKITNACC